MEDKRVTFVIQTYERHLNFKRLFHDVRARNAGRQQFTEWVVTRIPVQQPRRRRPVLQGSGANSKQNGVL